MVGGRSSRGITASSKASISRRGSIRHLATDHYHYFEDGGANYNSRYTTWEFFRGQEGDPWIGKVGDPVVPPNDNDKEARQDWINREAIRHDADFPQTKTFRAGVEFIDRNADEDNWLLHVETFDPHEPFTCDPQWKALFPDPRRQRDARRLASDTVTHQSEASSNVSAGSTRPLSPSATRASA